MSGATGAGEPGNTAGMVAVGAAGQGGMGLSLSELQLPRPYLDPATYFATASSYASSSRALARALGVYSEGSEREDRDGERGDDGSDSGVVEAAGAEHARSAEEATARKDRIILDRLAVAAGTDRRAMAAAAIRPVG